jgi:organic radical activating enzyme
MFLRLGGCNLSCRWCDTPYTWDWRGISDRGVAYSPRAELHPMAVGDVLDRLLQPRVPMVVITGGEPLNQQRRLGPLLTGLLAAGTAIEFETNGTVMPAPELVRTGIRFNVSPKLANSGDPARRRIRPDALRALAGTPKVAFKFVCAEPSDLAEVAALVERYELAPVWIMPEGDDAATVTRRLRLLADDVVARGWNLTGRLHTLAWSGQRAR